MSMLGRFRRPGGFVQLLNLIEGCDVEKQKNLLSLIATEDPGWAHLVRLKTITFERVMTWPEYVLMEIAAHLPDKIALSVLEIMTEAQKVKWTSALKASLQKEIRSGEIESQLVTGEGAIAAIKVIQTVRELEDQGLIHFRQFDLTLELDKRLAA